MTRLTLIDPAQQKVLATLLQFVLDSDVTGTRLANEATDLKVMLDSVEPHKAITVHVTDDLAADLSMAADLSIEDPVTAGFTEEQMPTLEQLAAALS